MKLQCVKSCGIAIKHAASYGAAMVTVANLTRSHGYDDDSNEASRVL